jgi:hypothetical protein
MTKRAGVPLQDIETATEGHISGSYRALRSSVAISTIIAVIFEITGILLLLAAVAALILSRPWETKSIQPWIICGALAAIGFGLLFSGWRLHISAELVQLQINLADDAQRAADAAEDAQQEIRAAAGKLDIQLRAIAASSLRTAAAVEALASTVRRPPPAV